jgi:acyl-CoA reductase-like NAD-dependent aldehyde dehydrogenase
MNDTLKTISPVDGRIYVERPIETAAGMKVDSDEEAVHLMNDSEVDLTAAIFSADSLRAEALGDALDADTVFLNRCDHIDPALPGSQNSDAHCSFSSVGFEQLTRPKSYHFGMTA